jgi:hypothetical protein
MRNGLKLDPQMALCSMHRFGKSNEIMAASGTVLAASQVRAIKE